MNENKFVIGRFENRNGTVSWRLSGWLFGERVRKNFKTREEASAEKAALEIKAEQTTSGLRSVVTGLSIDQLREAEAAIRRLNGQPHTLAFCVEYTLTNYRAPEHELLLTEGVKEYLAARNRDVERGIVSAIQVSNIKKELKLLQTHFPAEVASALTPERLTTFCERGKPALKTYDNRRSILSTFFKFALQRSWIVKNPIEKIPFYRIAHRRGSARTLSAMQARELMAYVETFEGGRLVPFFALCLFAGIRPCIRTGEILKLKPTDINLDTGVIHIEPEVSKVRMKRNITIQPNLAAWLRAYPADKFVIVPPNLEEVRTCIAKKFNLTHDIMRHTFISMFVAKFRSMGEAALQAGNSESIIRKHYLDLKSKEEAEQFFSIMPARCIAVAAA
ncbi:MAG: site-specific integrase [Nibricoccus sp.]